MRNHAGEKIVCRQCHALLDADDRFCRQCGASTAEAILLSDAAGADLPKRSPSAVPHRPDRRSPWSGNVWVVLTMLFVALGPLALPMLWQSRQFSLFWKVVLTVLVGIITVVIIVFLWYVISTTLAQLKPLLRLEYDDSFSPWGRETALGATAGLSGSA